MRGAIRHFAPAPDGALWAGGPAGLARFDGSTWRLFTAADGLKRGRINELAAVSRDEVWFHYHDALGLARLRLDGDKATLVHLDRTSGLPSDQVYMLGRDVRGRIWAGGAHGLTRVEAEGTLRRFTRNDGLLWDDLNATAFWAEPDGAIFVGTSRGLAHHAPPARERAPAPPRVVITSTELGGRERRGEATPSVPHGEGRFRARFAALTFRDPKAVLCRYRLGGFDERFNETNGREASYTTLPSGSFQFEVSCRSAGGWSAAATAAFTIEAAFWERWWFRGSALLAAALAVWALVWLRTRTLAAERRKLAEAVALGGRELAAANRELEGVNAGLAAANAQLSTRHRQMRLLLDNVEQGFLTVDREGTIAEQRSAAVERWLGPCQPGTALGAYLGRSDADVAAELEVGWAALLEGYLPLELALDQLPRRFTAAGRNFELGFRPILDGARAPFDQMLVVISDVTEALARQRVERAQRETADLFQLLVQDRQDVSLFRDEAADLVHRICAPPAPPLDELRRLVHTLKGNAGIHRLASIADLCQHMEDELAELGRPAPATVERLRERWREIDVLLAVLPGAGAPDSIELRPQEVAELLAAIRGGAGARDLIALVESWSLEPAAQRLRRMSEQVRRLGHSLGKGEVRVVEEPNGVRLDVATWASFWSALIHVLRNAVDHGLETPEERTAAGKSDPPTVTLRTRLTGDELVIEVEDDGAGIDWERITARARAAGLPAATPDDLVAALFTDGISTCDHPTEISGRGVGAGAIRQECEARSGRVEIRSEPGRGTTFSFKFPTTRRRSAATATPHRPATA
jgi:signal transduction histidine kinase